MQHVITSGTYTESQIATLIQQLQAAVNNLEYLNIARLATASTNRMSYTYEYLSANNTWVTITSGTGYANLVDTFNTTTFATPIQTTAIRITMHRNNRGTGIIEWNVMVY